MAAPTDVGVRVEFATSSFCETFDVRTDEDEHHHRVLRVPPLAGEGRIEVANHAVASPWRGAPASPATRRCGAA